jgi:hypothetical protein
VIVVRFIEAACYAVAVQNAVPEVGAGEAGFSLQAWGVRSRQRVMLLRRAMCSTVGTSRSGSLPLKRPLIVAAMTAQEG